MSTLSPSHILQVGLAFWSSKALLSAVELGLFTELSAGPQNRSWIGERLGLHPRPLVDFLDALVALRFLHREGDGAGALYSNTPETSAFLDRNEPGYVGGMLEMANDRLYPFWGNLTEGLRSGLQQNESRDNPDADIFGQLYADPARLEEFMNAMAGISAGNCHELAARFDFSRYQTLCDIGGATALLVCTVAAAHPHLRCSSFDLPAVEPIARRRIVGASLEGRVQTVVGNFFSDPFPQADVITMSLILHDWSLEKKKQLIAKAYAALPEGGALIAIENLIDDARRENAFALLMSLNMLIENGDAFDFSAADFEGWCRAAGFKAFQTLPLAGPSGAVIAFK